MTLCYVLINVKAGYVEKAVNELKKLNEVKEAHPVTGNIDIIAKIEAYDLEITAKVVLSKIQEIEGVDKTSTHIIVDL